MRKLLLCGLLFATSSPRLLAQPPDHRYDALKQALALSDSQILQLLQARASTPSADRQSQPASRPSAARTTPAPPPAPSLAERILDPSQQSKLLAIASVLDRYQLASLTVSAGLLDQQEWPGATLCLYHARDSAASSINLRDSQVRDLVLLRQATPKPPADQALAQALAILDDSQRATLADFRAALQLAREAIQLGLIHDPPKGEVLCL